MKKYFFTMATLVLFAIGFAASDEENSNSSSSSSTPQTEQKQESEAEREAREKKERMNEMMKEAYDFGKRQAMQFSSYKDCDLWFSKRWFTPETDEELSIYKRYKAEYDKGWAEGERIKAKMKNL